MDPKSVPPATNYICEGCGALYCIRDEDIPIINSMYCAYEDCRGKLLVCT